MKTTMVKDFPPEFHTAKGPYIFIGETGAGGCFLRRRKPADGAVGAEGARRG